MALGITAQHDAFVLAVAGVTGTAGRLRDDRDHVAHHVESLLDGGWSGAAASSYAEAWSVWRSGADQVLAALETMATLLRAADTDFVTSDQGVRTTVSRLTTRLAR